MAERGYVIDHSIFNGGWCTVSPNWRKPLIKRPSGRWRLNETYLKSKGNGHLHSCVDKQGQSIDFLLTAKRDKKVAEPFYSLAS